MCMHGCVGVCVKGDTRVFGHLCLEVLVQACGGKDQTCVYMHTPWGGKRKGLFSVRASRGGCDAGAAMLCKDPLIACCSQEVADHMSANEKLLQLARSTPGVTTTLVSTSIDCLCLGSALCCAVLCCGASPMK
jgi:hypothetical protein